LDRRTSFAASRLRHNKKIINNKNGNIYDHPTKRCCDDRLNLVCPPLSL
jgi:hypothetical protein